MSTQAHQASARTYLVVWVWLALLMLMSVLLSAMPISRGTVALIISLLSTVKATLVAMYYMHLKFDRRWLLIIATFPLVLIALATCLVLSSRLVRL